MEFLLIIFLVLTVYFIAINKKKIIAQKQQRSHLDRNDSSGSGIVSTHTFNVGSGNCIHETYGYYLRVFFAPHVPLSMLIRHGEYRHSLPGDVHFLRVKDGVWIQRSKEERDSGRLLWGEANFKTIGYIPRDGGDLLPYLKCCRKIMERELSTENNLVQSYLRLDELKSCPKGHLYYKSGEIKSEKLVDYFQFAFKSNENALRLILAAHELDQAICSLSYENIVELISRGIKSIENISEASDEELLSLKGVGVKRLERLRSNLKQQQVCIQNNNK